MQCQMSPQTLKAKSLWACVFPLLCTLTALIITQEIYVQEKLGTIGKYKEKKNRPNPATPSQVEVRLQCTFLTLRCMCSHMPWWARFNIHGIKLLRLQAQRCSHNDNCAHLFTSIKMHLWHHFYWLCDTLLCGQILI